MAALPSPIVVVASFLERGGEDVRRRRNAHPVWQAVAPLAPVRARYRLAACLGRCGKLSEKLCRCGWRALRRKGMKEASLATAGDD